MLEELFVPLLIILPAFSIHLDDDFNVIRRYILNKQTVRHENKVKNVK